LVLDIVKSTPEDRPCEQLKERLLLAHTLNKFKRFEKLMAVPSLRGQRLLAMLSAMLEFCPRSKRKPSFLLFFSASA
jgi:hypothetical protein